MAVLSKDSLVVEFIVDDKGTVKFDKVAKDVATGTDKIEQSTTRLEKSNRTFQQDLRRAKENFMWYAASIALAAKALDGFARAAMQEGGPGSFPQYRKNLNELNNSFNQFKVQVGTGVIPVLNELAGVLSKVFDWVSKLGTGWLSKFVLKNLYGLDAGAVDAAAKQEQAAIDARGANLTRIQAVSGKGLAAPKEKAAWKPIVPEDLEGELTAQNITQLDIQQAQFMREEFAAAKKEFEDKAFQDHLEALRKMEAAEVEAQNISLDDWKYFEEQKTAIAEAESQNRQLIAQAEAMAKESFTRSALGFMATMFGKGKEFAIGEAIYNIGGALAKALNLPYPANLAAYAQVFAMGTSVLNMIRSSRPGGGSLSAGGGGSMPVQGAPEPPRTTIVIKGKGLEALIDNINELTESGGVRLVATESMTANFAGALR